MSANNEIRKAINNPVPKDIDKKIKELSKRVDNIKKDIVKSDDKFKRQKQIDLKFAKNSLSQAKKVKQGKTIIKMDSETFAVKSSYLKSLKDPEKYLRGLYGRKLRNYQKKELEYIKQGKDTGSLRGLTGKLQSIDQKSIISSDELNQLENDEYQGLNDLFGIDFKEEPESPKYAPIVTSSNNEVAFTFISK